MKYLSLILLVLLVGCGDEPEVEKFTGLEGVCEDLKIVGSWHINADLTLNVDDECNLSVPACGLNGTLRGSIITMAGGDGVQCTESFSEECLIYTGADDNNLEVTCPSFNIEATRL